MRSRSFRLDCTKLTKRSAALQLCLLALDSASLCCLKPWEVCLQVHVLEQQLEDTIGYLSGLERKAGSLQSALDTASAVSLSALAEQHRQRELSSGTASTSQVSLTAWRRHFAPKHQHICSPFGSSMSTLCAALHQELLTWKRISA